MVVVAGERQSDCFRGGETNSIQVCNNELNNDVMSLFPSHGKIAMHCIPRVGCIAIFPLYPDF